jgi:hypothetical protein
MDSSDESTDVSRRDVLRRSAGAFGFLGADSSLGNGSISIPRPCPEVTLKPSVTHYGDHGSSVCEDDHPATEAIQAEVAESLQTNYPTVGALIDQGYIPYFDFLSADGDAGWSHWLNPAYLDDSSVLDPQRPASILVDHKWWRPIGVMFIATRNGDPVSPPPAVYGEDDSDDEACRPWHAHTGVAGLYSWSKFWLGYGDVLSGSILDSPCRTPWMMHVWAYANPDGVYRHGAPPRGNRGGPPAEDAGFETSAEPGEDLLSPDVLPDALVHRFSHL